MVKTAPIACYCRSDVQMPYPKPRARVYVRTAQVKKTLRDLGAPPAAVKLDKESGGDMDDVREMRGSWYVPETTGELE